MIITDNDENQKRRPGRPPGKKLTQRVTFFMDPRIHKLFVKVLKRMRVKKGDYLRAIIRNLIEAHIKKSE